MRSSWMNRAGKELLVLDYSGFESDVASLRAEIAAADRVICSQELGSVLAVVDLRGTGGRGAMADVYRMVRDSVQRTGPFMDRIALVGLTGAKRVAAEIAARLSGRNLRLFDTRAEAIAWLLNGDSIAIGPRTPWEPMPVF